MADAMYLRLVNFSATGKFIWPIPDKGLKKRLHRIKAPSLIVWGDQDKLVPPAYAQLFASKIANANIAMIKNAGHLPQFEQPEAYLKEAIAFFG